MQQLDLIIHNSTGLHARPARVFVDIAKQFRSTVHVRHGEKRVNAKSMIAVLTLGVSRGQRIQAVLRLIAGTVDAAHAAGKWVGVCGELAADPQAVPILIGLGVDELSVSVPAIPTVKAQIPERWATNMH
jgi:phosphotransferase system HPr (HPr) family protein